ncbi:MAG: 23S rRNA (guanosine(2251)-2'-O)-methyltransferase RlmB [Bacteroidota bacterium]
MSTRLIHGRNPVLEALRAGTRLTRILIAAGSHGGVVEEIRRRAAAGGVRIATASREEMEALAPGILSQGVAAETAPREKPDAADLLAKAAGKGEKPFLLLLDGIQDPRNLGALVRTAECAGAHGVVIPRHHAASVTDAVVKSSAGATEHLPVAEVTNLVPVMEFLRNEGIWIVGLDPHAGRAYGELDYRMPLAVVVGSEGRGIRRLVRERCDYLVRIPLRGKIGSLNASVAGGIVLFEVARTRSLSG